MLPLPDNKYLLAYIQVSFYFLFEVNMMLKILTTGILLIALSPSLWAQDSSGTAVIQFEQTRFDSIIVETDSLAERVFRFKNAGTDTLKILALRPG